MLKGLKLKSKIGDDKSGGDMKDESRKGPPLQKEASSNNEKSKKVHSIVCIFTISPL